MALEREARTNFMGPEIDKRNRNWDKVSAHLAESATDDVHGLGWGATYAATLQSGWTGDLKYSKNGLGQVWLRGLVIPGTINASATICTLPAEHRPSAFVPIFGYYSSSGFIIKLGALGANGDFQPRRNYKAEYEMQDGWTIHVNIIYQAEVS